MAFAAALGGLVGAGGQIAGGLLSAKGNEYRASDQVSSNYNPSLDYALQASQYDALNQIGFGNLDSIPGPLKQLFGQLQNSSLDAKTRRRAFEVIQSAMKDPTLLSDPYGKNFTPEQIMNMNRDNNHPGRIITRSGGGSANGGAQIGAGVGAAFGPVGAGLGALFGGLASSHANDTAPNGAQTQYIKRLEQALNANGMNLSDLQKTIQQQAEFDARIKRLKDAGLPQLAEQMIIDRARTGATASGIAAAGANYASTGESNNPLFQQLQAQDSRNLDRFSTRAGLQANFGGISQAAAQKQITDAELDQNLRVLQNALTTSGLLQATLAPGTQAASGQSSGQANAAQIASQQAIAANSLRQQGNAASADSFGNAIAAGTSALGSAFSNYGLYKQFGANSGGFGGPGSTQNQFRTQNAMFG